ncbi:MAG: Endonuclease III [Holosporales bacterium]
MTHNQFINTILDRFEKINPNPRIDLDYSDAYTLLVAVVLSAQATDKGVNKITPALFKHAPTPQAMVDLGVESVEDLVKTINHYKNKSKYIVELSKILVEKYEGNVPHRREDLESLPGVGRKSANVILSNIFNQPTLAVDTHVFRVAHRLQLSKGKTPLKVEMDLLPLIPYSRLLKAHHWLVLHGRYTCKAIKPNCRDCCINDICPSAFDAG